MPLTMERDVPTEILGNVIQVFVQTAWFWKDQARNRQTVALVNKRWMAITYSTRELWNPLTVHRVMSGEFLSFALQRLGGGAIMLEIDVDPWTSYKYSAGNSQPSLLPPMGLFCEEVLDRLRNVFGRVERLKVNARTLDDWVVCVSRLATYTPGQMCAVTHAVSSIPRTLPPMTTAAAIGLRSATRYAVYKAPLVVPTAHTYGRLADLRLYEMESGTLPWRTLSAVLNAAAMLKTLHLVNVECGLSESDAAVTLSSVENLHVVCRSERHIAPVERLIMPAIRSFDATVSAPGLARCWRAFLHSQRVNICVEGAGIVDVEGILQVVSSAHCLDLSRCGKAVVQRVIASAGAGRLSFPVIQELKISQMLEYREASAFLGPKTGLECVIHCEDAFHDVRWIRVGGLVESVVTLSA